MAKAAKDLSIEELKALLKEKKEAASKEWQKEGYKLKKEIDAYVLKTYGKKLEALGKKPADIYLCANPDSKVKAGDQFKYPEGKKGPEGETVWTYSGRGMVPQWLQGKEDDYRITPETEEQEAA